MRDQILPIGRLSWKILHIFVNLLSSCLFTFFTDQESSSTEGSSSSANNNQTNSKKKKKMDLNYINPDHGTYFFATFIQKVHSLEIV